MSDKLKEPAVLISVTTAVGVGVASYYFFNRMALMQEEIDAMKSRLNQQDEKLLSVDQRMLGIMHRTGKAEKKLGKVESKVGTLADAMPNEKSYNEKSYPSEKSTPKSKPAKKPAPQKKKVQEYQSDEEDDLVSAFK